MAATLWHRGNSMAINFVFIISLNVRTLSHLTSQTALKNYITHSIKLFLQGSFLQFLSLLWSFLPSVESALLHACYFKIFTAQEQDLMKTNLEVFLQCVMSYMSSLFPMFDTGQGCMMEMWALTFNRATEIFSTSLLFPQLFDIMLF